ncbi:MAG: helix-turn-helix transcriptional regulator [Deltaproteobacteria bacterium]|nr:helix-turn-helix transcriptional regulator [Deltaproteobacteria bacterium]
MARQGVILVTRLLGRTVLAGRAAGQADKHKLETAALAAVIDGRVAFDLGGVEALSSSYFDAAIWPLWKSHEVFPSLSNVPPVAVDDIKIVLAASGGAVWCTGPGKPQLLGELDPSLATTLDRIVRVGELSASDLLELDRRIGATAWSNRLASLYELRLVRRRKDGRRLLYRPAWKE